MPETRDWQEDWKHVEVHRHGKTLCNWPIQTLHGIIEDDMERLAYWMQEYKKISELYDELKEQLARINCDYHSLKDKFLNMREECGAEKKRADSLLDLVQKVSEEISWKNEGDGIDRALKMIYKWCHENPGR